jgi:hypothetical protein
MELHGRSMLAYFAEVYSILLKKSLSQFVKHPNDTPPLIFQHVSPSAITISLQFTVKVLSAMSHLTPSSTSIRLFSDYLFHLQFNYFVFRSSTESVHVTFDLRVLLYL